MKKLIPFGAIALLSACASTSDHYMYHVQPTPIQKQQTKYRIENVDLTLTNTYEGKDDSSPFASEAELQSQFFDAIRTQLSEKGLLGSVEGETLDAKISINYRRRFNYGGKALNKPVVSHTVTIIENDKQLASFALSDYTTKYAYLEDLAVNTEIAAFSWDEEDEPRDINLIAKMIVEDLINAGK